LLARLRPYRQRDGVRLRLPAALPSGATESSENYESRI
jgi:hypothetical protein